MKIFTILREEAARGGYTIEQLLAKDYTPRISKLRHYAMWRARKETGRSWGAIGLVFQRHHTTIMHGYARIEAMEPVDRAALPAQRPIPNTKVGPRFYMSRPCRQGHDGLRYMATRRCVECKKLSDRRSDQRAKMDARDGRGDAGVSCEAVE